MYAPSQWEKALHCNAIFHWLGAYTKWSLYIMNYSQQKCISYPWNQWQSVCLHRWLHIWNLHMTDVSHHWSWGNTLKASRWYHWKTYWPVQVLIYFADNFVNNAGIILGMGSAYERWHYTKTAPLIGWTHTNNDPWQWLSYSIINQPRFKADMVKLLDDRKQESWTSFAYYWLSGKLWYLQHSCVGDTIVYH